jgi:hypothetical protein
MVIVQFRTFSKKGVTTPSDTNTPLGLGFLAMSRWPITHSSLLAPAAHVGGVVKGRYMMPATGCPMRLL